MKSVTNIKEEDFDSVPVDPFWNTSEERELKMHKIHAYPAKFPAFITPKALEFVGQSTKDPSWIADVFCGCGTVAFEAKRSNINFWGCDINPVATMIAEVKSQKYRHGWLQKYFDSILVTFDQKNKECVSYDAAKERLKYWYDPVHYTDLSLLKVSIEETIPKSSDYRRFFLCAFSNILKPTSRWLTKSIKPQIDPNKHPTDVISAFKSQCHFMMEANQESDVAGNSQTSIITGNFLSGSMKRPKVDMIITSPPYVTSYEYADLHQLSILWLEFAEDYRDLRAGAVGSRHHVYDFNFNREIKRLNDTGRHIVFRLRDQHKSKARSVAKYFLDMQQVANTCYSMLPYGGPAVFVIGNTEYKGIRIDNVRHLAESLESSGFSEILVTKRKISKKNLTPYRDDLGRFTTDSTGRKVYSEEFILIGRK